MDVLLEKQPQQTEKNYAGFWLRFAAYLIDSIVVGIPLSILSFVILIITLGTTGVFDAVVSDVSATGDITDQQAIALIGGYFVVILISFLLSVLYYAGLHASKWQATIGKKLLNLKVTDLNGNRISFWRGLGRYIAMTFLSGIFFIGFIMAAFTEKKQSLHDLIAGTVVIKKAD